VEYRCRVGHAYSLQGLSEAHADALERALWIAIRRLQEQRSIQRRVANNHPSNSTTKRRIEEHEQTIESDIALLYQILGRI